MVHTTFSDWLILLTVGLYATGLAQHGLPWWLWVMVVLASLGDGVSVEHNRKAWDALVDALRKRVP